MESWSWHSYGTSLRVSRRYANRNMRHHVRVWRTKLPIDDDAVATGDEKLLYEGRARVYGIAAGGMIDDGEMVYMSSSYISIPWEVDWTQVNDLFEVVRHDDPAAESRWYRVLNVDGGGELPVVRRHTVTSVQHSSSWGNRDATGNRDPNGALPF